MDGAPGNSGGEHVPRERPPMPVEQHEGSGDLCQRCSHHRVPDQRREREIERRGRNQDDRCQRDPDHARTAPDRHQQQRIRSRLQQRLADAASVWQILEPWADGQADRPENPIERRANGVPVHMRRRPDEWQIGKRAQGNRPVANLVSQQQESRADSPDANGQRRDEDQRGERNFEPPHRGIRSAFHTTNR